jgi:hypothetical protein
MTNIVEDYRRTHPSPARPHRRSWILIGVLMGIVFAGGVGTAVMTVGPELFGLTAIADDIAPSQPSRPDGKAPITALRPRAGGDYAPGSVPRHPQGLPATGILDGPVTGLIITSIGLITGLIVYLGLGRLLPVSEPEHPYQLVRGRREIAQEQRYHGGPIRD